MQALNKLMDGMHALRKHRNEQSSTRINSLKVPKKLSSLIVLRWHKRQNQGSNRSNNINFLWLFGMYTIFILTHSQKMLFTETLSRRQSKCLWQMSSIAISLFICNWPKCTIVLLAQKRCSKTWFQILIIVFNERGQIDYLCKSRLF